jgi:hypothetical protein
MTLGARTIMYLHPEGTLLLIFVGTVLAVVLCAISEKLTDERERPRRSRRAVGRPPLSSLANAGSFARTTPILIARGRGSAPPRRR